MNREKSEIESMTYQLESLVTVSFEDIQELLEDLDDLHSSLERRFIRQLFRRVRQRTGSQYYWADAAGVSQGTIGNWERGYTVPNVYYRRALRAACVKVRSDISEAFGQPQGDLLTRINIAETSAALRETIIRAALTDFRFDEKKGTIVPVPFSEDFDPELVAEIQDDRDQLLKALVATTGIICETLTGQSNATDERLARYFDHYNRETRAEAPNPRLLNRLGATISKVALEDEFRSSSNIVDFESVDGFIRDHTDLMRLYFREALARAQEIDSAELQNPSDQSSAKEFYDVAEVIDGVIRSDGAPFVDASIPTLLRDIASEIVGLNDAIALTNDSTRRDIYSRRRDEAVKNGRIYVGRFVFYSALLVSIGIPSAPHTMEALGEIVGLTEANRPGSVRSQYERMQHSFPALPSIPELDSEVRNHG